jgi:hypothetical protein
MCHFVNRIALLIVFPAFCLAQSRRPSEVLDHYLARSISPQAGCSMIPFAVRLDASIPKLRKEGSMSGLKLISQTGRPIYQSLQFKGDNLVKTAVIGRFLVNEEKSPAGTADYAITKRNYSLDYAKTSAYNGIPAYVFRLRPKRKHVGLLRGELWLDANTAAPLRVWGDFVKSPSMFVRNLRVVQDFQNVSTCSLPLRLLVTVQTRVVGIVELTVWLHPADDVEAAFGPTGASERTDTQGFAQ